MPDNSHNLQEIMERAVQRMKGRDVKNGLRVTKRVKRERDREKENGRAKKRIKQRAKRERNQ